jgi:hypothetical protein
MERGVGIGVGAAVMRRSGSGSGSAGLGWITKVAERMTWVAPFAPRTAETTSKPNAPCEA